MHESDALTEADLALVEALQVAPRAPWPALARATGTAAVTAARRWHRLTERGAAWVTGPPGVSVWNAQCVAYVEVTVDPAANRSVADLLAADRHALSVEIVAGDADLFVTVGAADLDGLTAYLLERLDRVPGVRRVRTRIATRVYRDGSAWRLGALARSSVAGLRTGAVDGPHPPSPTAAPPPVTLLPGDREILVQLGLDGRSSYRLLGEVAGLSEATARRRLTRLRAGGAVLLRAEVAARLAGWAVPVVLALDAPSARLPEVATALGAMREVRLVATVAGTPPLLVAAWLPDLARIHAFEVALAQALPEVRVVQRLVTLRTVKRMGRLLDDDGRAIGAVPTDVWADPRATP